MKHDNQPLAEAIRSAQETIPFTTPGHKRNTSVSDSRISNCVFSLDPPLLSGADDRRMSREVREKAEQLAAEAWGADTAMFSANGSTLSMQVAILSAVRDGEKIIVARNAHKSIHAGLILAGAYPIYVYPAIDEELQTFHVVTPDAVQKAIEAHPDAKAVVIVSPTYYGVAGDIQAIAAGCHERDIPLIVDEAWGAHFPFHPDLPTSAIASGADFSVCSIHKTLTGLGQSSLMLMKGGRIDFQRVRQARDLLESTSISTVILASIDNARHTMATEGRQLLDRALALASEARQRIARIKPFRVITQEVVGHTGAAALDQTKLLIDVRGLGMTGFAVAEWLRAKWNITLELAEATHIMALITVGDSKEKIERLVDALTQLSAVTKNERSDVSKPLPRWPDLEPEMVMKPREAFMRHAKPVPLREAAGQVSAEMVSPYPPGSPVLSPGERVTQKMIEYLEAGVAQGMYIPDVADSSLKTIRVVE